MSVKNRVYPLLLSAVLLLSACTPSVQSGTEALTGQGTNTAPSTDTTSAEAITTQEEAVHKSEFPIDKLTISNNDISLYSVVYSSEMSTSERNALLNLVSLVKEATGYSLPRIKETTNAEYEIVIGTTSRDSDKVKQIRSTLGDEGYALINDGKRLYITGKTVRGTTYGIYSFLEDYLGVRFYSSSYHVIHETARAEVPANLEYTYNPKLSYRDAFWYDINQHGEFASELKINGAFGKSNMENYAGAEAYAGGFVHTLASLSEMTGNPTDRQPCLSDETVYQTVLSNVKKCLQSNPDAKIVSVSQNDSTASGRGCQCEKCKAIDTAEGTPMGSLLTFVNRIANDIKDEFPGVYVDTLAYRYTRQAPKTIVPADNVIIRLCSIECCFSHPLSDTSCSQNAAFKKDIEEWSKICKNLYIWDYTTNFMYYLSPFPNLGVLWDNVQFYVNHSVVGLFEQGNYQSYSGEFGELRAYLLAKLLWNPDITKEQYFALMDEFLKDYYGAGWEYIRQYIDKTSAKAAETHIGIYDSPEKMISPKDANGKKNMDLCNELVDLWSKALAAAETDVHKAHVEQSRIQSEYYALFINFNRQTERFEEMYKSLGKYNITLFREGATVPVLSTFKIGPKSW